MRKPSPYFTEKFINQIIPLYIEEIQNPRTANEYFSYTCLLCDYLEKDFLDITPEDAQKYYNHLISQYHNEELSRKTINCRFAAYKHLAGFICMSKFCPDYTNPFYQIKKIPVKSDVSTTCIISMSDLDKIMSAAKPDRMMYLILALAGRCAFTLSEIIGLKESMITISDDRVYVAFPKKTEYASIDIRQLPIDVSQLMIEYLKENTYYSEEKYLFYNKYKHPITKRNIDGAVKKIVKNAGISNEYSIKDIRTRCIIDMKNAGLPEELIADYTGLQMSRIRKYDNAARVARECPADLVNYQLKTRKEEN